MILTIDHKNQCASIGEYFAQGDDFDNLLEELEAIADRFDLDSLQDAAKKWASMHL